MTTPDTTPTTATLSPVLTEHLRAVNAFDLEAILATFAEDALVNDARREFWGIEAIRAWVAKEMVGDKVTLDVTEVLNHHDQTLVRARYDGEYDKANLPDELILTSYITLHEGRISTLIIVRNMPSPY